ncbi:MAG: AAA family ATPase, partial [Verrucomicrobia bacterium]|nr:AAA family ATPase [Verrucomicrobiota bacterium]
MGASPAVIELSRYEFDSLRTGKEFSLYRGRGIGEFLPILVRAPSSERPEPTTLKQLEHEYSLRNDLDPEWAARPIALSQLFGRTVLVMQDPGGELLDGFLGIAANGSAADEGGKPMELPRFLLLAISLAAGVNKVHRRGLIHKDINPAKILVDFRAHQAWLTGFGISSRTLREQQALESPELVSGTLPYIAPEQTRRMNRSIDSRSDLYSLGVTFYQMLTGALPFSASDPLGWIHSHIARQPAPPSRRVPEIPPLVSAIVMKLMAKAADERYQTAAGLEADLRRCLEEYLRSSGVQEKIPEFQLGQHDTPDRLVISGKLYGRVEEIDQLASSFDRIATGGKPELLLVSGHSGVGKSAIVNELQQVVIARHGLFGSGKCEQGRHEIPYTTLAHVFRSLVTPLLGKSEAELDHWRGALLKAVGPNGPLLVDLVPELKLIIGEQPAVPELSLQDAQTRFRLSIRRFIGVFAQPEHPLALFLDDLQWADVATLDLIKDLLFREGPWDPIKKELSRTSYRDVENLLLIGAYRANEVDCTHPLARTLGAIRQTGAAVQEIKLAPLTCEDVEQLVADSLRCGAAHAAPLAQLIHEKTGGNPFFAIQFISALAEEGLLKFNHREAQWSWDLDRIHAKGYTANVVDLMVRKLSWLPERTKTIVKQLAFFGNSAEIATLCTVVGAPEQQLHSDLWEAVRQELVQKSGESYQFLHDRFQETAYSLTPEESRAEVHLRFGRLLVAQTPLELRNDSVFGIVNQINRGAALISSWDERKEAAELNLIAGRRAKASAAYAAALRYLAAGAALLTEDDGERSYDLAFALEFERAECEFLTGDLAASEQRLSQLGRRARTLADRTAVTCLLINLFVTLNQCDRSINVGLEYLRSFGIEWAPHPTRHQMQQEFDRIWQLLGRRSIKALIELPILEDAKLLAQMNVLTALLPPVLFTDENLFSLVVAHMANVSLEHGNSDGSCLAYVWLGLLLGPHFNNYPAAFEFGQLGFDLVEKRGLDHFRARVYLDYSHVVNPWMKHARYGPALVRKALEAANKIGDLTFAAYSSCNLVSALLAAGGSLNEAQEEAEKRLAFAREARFGAIADIITGQLRLILALRGATSSLSLFNGIDVNEVRFEQNLEDSGNAVVLGWYWVRKLQERFFAGDAQGGIKAAEKMERFLWTIPSHLEVAEYHFYAALCRAAFYDRTSAASRRPLMNSLYAHYKQLGVWAEHCRENFENCVALVGAEIARIEGRELDAERLYEEAIRSSHENDFTHHEALASELAAGFYAARGYEKIARLYLREARYGYIRWGARGKVRQLEERHPYLREETPAALSSSAIVAAPLEYLDLASVIKLSRAVSGEILLQKLIETLLRIVIEHAGAERGLLILPQNVPISSLAGKSRTSDAQPFLSPDGEQYRIEAEIRTGPDGSEIHLPQTATTVSDLSTLAKSEALRREEVPESLLRYVIRTREKVILDDASSRKRFFEDAYVRQRRPRSVLCLPLLKQAKLIGVLYLENNLAPGVFTPKRLAMLELLASQAAISLDHARVYAELSRENSERKRAEEELCRSEALLAQGQKMSHTGSWRWQVATGAVDWSEEHFRIFQIDPKTDKLSFAMVMERVHPEDRARIEEILNRSVRDKSDFEFEYRIVLADGSIKFLRGIGQPQVTNSGDLEFIGTTMDITGLKRAEELQVAVAREREMLLHQRAVELAKANEALRSCLDALAAVPELDEFMGQVMAAITRQLGAVSSNLRVLNAEQDRMQIELI